MQHVASSDFLGRTQLDDRCDVALPSTKAIFNKDKFDRKSSYMQNELNLYPLHPLIQLTGKHVVLSGVFFLLLVCSRDIIAAVHQQLDLPRACLDAVHAFHRICRNKITFYTSLLYKKISIKLVHTSPVAREFSLPRHPINVAFAFLLPSWLVASLWVHLSSATFSHP